VKHGLDTIDYWVNSAAGGRSNIAPEKIPWHALRQILCHVIYGGRVDNVFDSAALSSFIEQFFQPVSYNQDFSLVSGESVCLPEGNKHSDALRWINSLPDDQPPTWLGLSSNAELVLSITHSKKVITDLQQIQEVVDVGDEEDLETHTGEDEVEALPAWLRSLGPLVDAWLSRLPTQPQLPSESRTNPVARFLDREMRFGVHLYTMVSQNLSEVAELCKGVKSPQSIRDIALQLSKGLVPTPWRLYASIDYSMSTWLPNLVQRLEQLTRLSNNVDAVASMGVWLGGLFSPEAFVTATRQVTAQKHSWALEQLELQVQLGDDTLDEDCFTICDLNLENASISGSQIEPSDVVTTVIPKSIFRWVQQDQTQTNKVSLPVYLDSSRKNLLLTIGVEVTDSKSAYNRGLAIVASL
jgi:dynein heavy chain 1